MAALERAKASGVIERPLDACVDIYSRNSGATWLRDTLQPVMDDLAGLFIVSEVRVHDDELPDASLVASEGLAFVAVTVTPATGEKCTRCWMRLESVGQDVEHPTLCGRCASRVARLQS